MTEAGHTGVAHCSAARRFFEATAKQILATEYRVTVLDWLGFGESPCPPLDYNPVLFQQLLEDFIREYNKYKYLTYN